MKKLAILALAAMSTVAFAGGGHGNPPPPNNPPTQVCGVCETNDINVGAPQLQVTMLKGTSSVANASGKLLATVIDTSLPAALGFLAKEKGSVYKADEEDRAELEKALGEYMKLKGGDIPPGMMVLVLVLSIYGAKIPMAIQHRKMNVERLELEQQKKDLEARERALAERLRIADSKKDDTP